MGEIVIGVPQELAAEFIHDELADDLLRGVDVVSLLTLAVDGTSAIVAIVVARESIGEVVRRLVRHVGKSREDEPRVRVSIKTAAGTQVLVDVNDSAGLARLEVSVTTVVLEQLDGPDIKQPRSLHTDIGLCCLLCSARSLMRLAGEPARVSGLRLGAGRPG
jgi:hypothetical protein